VLISAMASFFKDVHRLISGAGSAIAGAKLSQGDAGRPTPPPPPPYDGRLSPGHFQLSEGAPLGLGAVVPQTLAYEPRAQLIAICTPEGHVRIFGQDLELCLRNPEAPVHTEFLLFPRPGLLLAFGVVANDASSSGSPSGSAGCGVRAGGSGRRERAKGGWVAQWWDLRSGEVSRIPASSSAETYSGVRPPQLAALRFGVVCVAAAAAGASLVFLGTDEGDVRVFDAGEQPHVGAYCIPWDKLAVERQVHQAAPRPCPVMALAPAPGGVPELLVGAAEGGIVLWLFEKHKAARTFVLSPPGPVGSLVWHSGGSGFLAASRSDIVVFSKNNSSALARVPLPGGPASSVTLLRWREADGGGPIHGEVLLRRGAPGPAILNLWGAGWAQMDNLFLEADNTVSGAVLCLPCCSGTGAGEVVDATDIKGPLGVPGRGVPCGCMVQPSAVAQKELLGGSAVQHSAIFERLAAAPLVLAALGDPGTQLVVCTVPPMRPLAWPASWGSLELVDATSVRVVPRNEADLDAHCWLPSVAASSSDDRCVEAGPSSAAGTGAMAAAPSETLAGIEGGFLVAGGAVAVPEGRSLVSTNGWLICRPRVHDSVSDCHADDALDSSPPPPALDAGAELQNPGSSCPSSPVATSPSLVDASKADAGPPPASNAEEATASDEEGVRWHLPCDLSLVTSYVKLSEGALAALILWSGERDESTILINVAERSATCRGSQFAAVVNDQPCPIDVQPSAEHAATVLWNDGRLVIEWDGVAIGESLPVETKPHALGWSCRAGELHIQSMVAVPPQPPAQPPPSVEEQQEAEVTHRAVAADVGAAEAAGPEETEGFDLERLAEAMFARRFANFAGFAAGGGGALEAEPQQFVSTWNSMVGGWQGILCTGHRDGTLRVWLRAHSAVLLLHTLSVRTLKSLPWRPQLDLRGTRGAGESGGSSSWRAGSVQRVAWYDGVDACPVVASIDDTASADEGSAITVVAFEPAVGMLAAGTAGGTLVMFCWRSSPQPLPASELAEWELQGLSMSLPEGGQEGVRLDGAEPPCGSAEPILLPAGFACQMRLRQHHAPVTFLRLLTARDRGRVHVVSADATSHLCVADGRSGDVFFLGNLDPHAASDADPLADLLVAGTPGNLPPPPLPASRGPRPPPETVEAVVLADCVLHHAAAPAEPQEGDGHEDEGVVGSGAYVLALSSGQLRQLTLPDARLLDCRIWETRLPDLPSGSVLAMHLDAAFLVVAQSAMVHILMRPTPPELAVPRSVPLPHRGVAAGVVKIDGELCLCVVLATLAVHCFAIPSLRFIASLDVTSHAAPFLAAAKRPRGGIAATTVVPGGCSTFGNDGYFVLQGGASCSSEGIRLWWASVLAGARALDEAARLVPAAQIAQASTLPPPQPPPSRESQGASRGGLLHRAAANLFGGGGGSRPLRECVAPSAGGGNAAPLPREVDSARIDQGRGLPPAWRDPTATVQPARAPGVAASSAASSARAEIAQAHSKALERGEKLGDIADKSQKLADDSANFLQMAKQLNAQQSSRWF